MTGIKKESHQRRPSPRRIRKSSIASTPVNPAISPVNDDCLIDSDMIIEIDISNNATTHTSRVNDSISSISGSAIPSASTLPANESTPTSSISRTNSTLSSFSRVGGSISSLSRSSPHVSSPIITTGQSPSLSSIVTTTKHDIQSTIVNNNPNLNNVENINKRNKRRKRVTYFTLTDSSYSLYLRNRIIDDNKSAVISLSSIRRTAINHFESIKYKSSNRLVAMGSTRRSLRFIDPVLDAPSTPELHVSNNGYDLNSRKLRRYIIEDVMYINPVENVLLLICEDSTDFVSWKKIIVEQNSGLSNITFGSKVFHQVNATVIKNVSRSAFVNGEFDNDMMDYHVLGIGGAAVSLSFLNCVNYTGIELKFSQLLTDVNIQMWGVAPMRRNLVRTLQRRTKDTRMGLLKCMLDELSGDHAQSLQLATIAQQLMTEDDKSNKKTPELDHNLIMSMVGFDTTLDTQVARKALNHTGHEASLSQLNNIVQTAMMDAVASTYGFFCSPNSPIISNETIVGLVDKFKLLMPVHHASILTMLNVDKKLKDKRSVYLVQQYDRLSFWIFLSMMRSRNNHLFTWWANISTAARYGAKNEGSASFSETVFFGSATTHNTMIRNTAKYRDNKKDGDMIYTDRCRKTISIDNDSFIIIAMDNNQRGQRKKQQQEGTSNNFIVVTHSMAIKPLIVTSRQKIIPKLLNIKSPITYIDQAIVSVEGMSGFENITTIEDMISCITLDNSVNTPKSPNYDGKRVNSYYDVVRLCYGLIQQRKFLSRNDKEYEFIDQQSMNTVQSLVNNLHSNRGYDGLYAKARCIQKQEVKQWFGDRNKLQICFLPTSKEDETTNLGCATVFLEILENAGLIRIQRQKFSIGGEEKEKLVVETVIGASEKWVYLIGDGLTHVRLKSFVNTINDSLYSFEDDYETRRVLSLALKQVVLGVGDLHGGGFAILNTIYTVFYGGYLQAFQTAMGWKRINGGDVAKTYQQAGSLVEIVYTEVMRNLHYMHASIYYKAHSTTIATMDPTKLALKLVLSFNEFLDKKIETSTDEVLIVNINFVRLVSQYKLFKEAVTEGDSITVEKIYNDYLPIFVYLGKHNYYNILLDQTEEYYDRIPYRILQLVRQNRFQKLYDGTDRKNTSMSHWAIDALMELMNKNVKELDFSNKIEAWELHSQNIMFALESRVFVTNEYSNHRSMEVQDAKNSGSDKYTDLSQKGNIKTKTIPLNRTKEKAMCSEILSLACTFTETTKRKFDNNTYWDMLSLVTTKLGKVTRTIDTSIEDTNKTHTLSNLAASIFDHGKNATTDETVDMSLLDNNVMSALNGDVLINEESGEVDNNDDDTDPDEVEVDIDVNNGIGSKSIKVKKVNIHDAATVNILLKGIEKMKAKNLPAVRYRKNLRTQREQVALRDSIYENMMNIKENNFINVTVCELNQQEDGNIFGLWDNEINSLI